MNLLLDDCDVLEQEFLSWVTDPAFPCVGAKSALAHGNLRIVPASDIRSAWDDVHIHRELLRWVEDYREQPGHFRSLAIVFAGPETLDEKTFESAMWERLQSLADKDHWLGQKYDSRVSADPDDPHFSLSFGNEAFFVVGLHPGASRPARRFGRPALVFNLHDQFERLRNEGRYERMSEVILDRDERLAGSRNPMLAPFGTVSEARQYSGRKVSDDWRCPFRDPRGDVCTND